MTIRYIMKCSVGRDITVRFYSNFVALKDGLLRWSELPGAKCECYNVEEFCPADLADFIAYLYGKLFYNNECVIKIKMLNMERYLDEK